MSWYEERQDAMNEFIADHIPDMTEYTLDDDIPESIAEGIFDEAVRKRIKVLFDGWTVGQRHRFYDYLLEGLK